MKKLLGISLVAALAVAPMMAMAAGEVYATNGSPAHAEANAANNITTTAVAPYASVDAQASTNIATTSYVKGAYNAAIQAVNKVAADVASLDSDMDAYVLHSEANPIAEDGKELHYATDSIDTSDNFVGANFGHLDAQVYTNTTAIGDANSGLTQRVGTLETNTTVDSVVANKTNYITTSASAADNIETLNAQVVSLTDSVSGLNSDSATKEGVVATIEKATVSGTVSGDATGTVDVYTTWNTDTHTPVNVTTSFANVALSNGAVSVGSKYYSSSSDTTGETQPAHQGSGTGN